MAKNAKAGSTPARATEGRETPGVGRTEQKRANEVEPRLPHERDESADGQARNGETGGQAFNEDIGEKAFDDVASGRQDTGRLPVTDQTYEGLKEEPPRVQKKVNTGDK